MSDDDELLDLYDADGRRSGRVKARSAVHRDGDWHRTFHCWVVARRQAGRVMILQRRGIGKDVHPGLIDVSVAGHLAAGETDADGVREIAEELGIDVPFSRLVPLGVTREEARGPGLVDNEHCAAYLLRHDAPLADYRPPAGEVDGLVEVSVDALRALVAGETSRVPAVRLDAASRRIADVEVRSGELVARPARAYADVIARAAAA